MSVRIRKYKKPVLSLSLQAGGSLAASTTYYFSAFFRGSVPVGVRNGRDLSPAADQTSIVTDATNKTIIVSWKTVGDITAFSDAGGGKVNVTCEDHCLGGGENVTIQNTTNYNGDYEITWIDYDTFQITETWAGDDAAGDWYCEEFPNGCDSIYLYVDDAPVYSGGAWVRGSFFSHKAYQDGYNSNDIEYSSLSQQSSTGFYQPELSDELDDKLSNGFSKTKGIVKIEFDGGSHTMADVADAVEAAHCEDTCFVSSYAMTCLAAVETVSECSVDFAERSVTLIGGTWYDAYKNIDMQNSDLTLVWLRYAQIIGDLTKTFLWAPVNGGLNISDVTIDNTSISGYRFTLDYSHTLQNVTLLGQKTGCYLFLSSLADDDYVRNIKLISAYLYCGNLGILGALADYALRDIVLDNDGFDYDIYILRAYSDSQQTVKYYNLTLEQDRAIYVRLNSSIASGITAEFYYKQTVLVKDSDGVIEGQTVTITPTVGDAYEDTTDANGQAEIWLKDFDYEISSATDQTLTEPSNSYGPFSLTIEREGYADYSHEFTMGENKAFEITLQESSAGGSTTLDDLLSELADILNSGVDFSASTTPAETQVISWINAAMRYIIDSTSGDIHQHLVKIIDGSTPEDTPSYLDISGFADSVYRVDSVSIRLYGETDEKYIPCARCSMKNYVMAYYNPFLGTVTSPVWTRSEDIIYFLPGGIRFDYLMTYVKTWNEVVNGSDRIVVADEFTEAIIEYVVYLFYKQQQQLDMEMTALQKTNNLIQSAATLLKGYSYVA